MHINPDGINLLLLAPDERVGLGMEDGSDGVKHEAGMVNGDLEGLGDGGGADSLGRRLFDEFLLEWD